MLNFYPILTKTNQIDSRIMLMENEQKKLSFVFLIQKSE